MTCTFSCTYSSPAVALVGWLDAPCFCRRTDGTDRFTQNRTPPHTPQVACWRLDEEKVVARLAASSQQNKQCRMRLRLCKAPARAVSCLWLSPAAAVAVVYVLSISHRGLRGGMWGGPLVCCRVHGWANTFWRFRCAGPVFCTVEVQDKRCYKLKGRSSLFFGDVINNKNTSFPPKPTAPSLSPRSAPLPPSPSPSRPSASPLTAFSL